MSFAEKHFGGWTFARELFLHPVTRNNGVYGFLEQGTSPGSLPEGCSATANNGGGFDVTATGCTFFHCAACGNLGGSGVVFGFSASVGARVVDGISSRNTGIGIVTGQGSSGTGCQVRRNSLDGIQIPNDCYVARNHGSANGRSGNPSAGVHATSDDNRLVDNSAIFNHPTGLQVDGISNLITDNSSRFQTTKNLISAAGNHDGQLSI